MVLLENEAEDLTRKLVELAKEGDLLPSEGRALADTLEARRKAKENEQWGFVFPLVGKSASTPVKDDEEE